MQRAHEPFLKAIFDNLDDDGPRLVYADWLEENGENDRAELIRLQCLGVHPELAEAATQRVVQLIGNNWKAWWPVSAGRTCQPHFRRFGHNGPGETWGLVNINSPMCVVWRRGFVDEVSCYGDQWFPLAKQWLDHPVRHLTLTSCSYKLGGYGSAHRGRLNRIHNRLLSLRVVEPSHFYNRGLLNYFRDFAKLEQAGRERHQAELQRHLHERTT